MTVIAEHTRAAARDLEHVVQYFQTYRAGVPDNEVVADLTFGNPHEQPLPELVATLHKHTDPQATDWFAYKLSEAHAREAVAKGLSDELGLAFAPEDIAMTRGAFGAIALAFSLLLEPGDECVFSVPGWFLYETVLTDRNAVTVKVPLKPDTHDLDVDAIEAALTPRTRIVIVNSPHNPTGVVYSQERLEELAQMLRRKSEEFGRPIFILSDEPYRRIRFDGTPFTSPANVYPWTLIDYSYGKVLLAPGLRLGYLAFCPDMPDDTRAELAAAAMRSQLATGHAFPDAVLQYAAEDLESISIDIAAYERKRDRMYNALTQWGYEMTAPAGTFYLWGKAPDGDATAFTAALAEKGVFIAPGTLFECPGDFRISLTASEDMIEASLPAFQAISPSATKA
ncbi:MAG: aminotransferase class I/II-fold pyridoxal phosphate-dependent enzyme [Rhodobacteraceae bacterium]|jgi:aspartate aminotransferase|nr:aminotransferase class I/II-fold pyridoxal phosphate-dependent enzyme [Alphaproteobacteria bacterium]MBT8475720.1 aminotransferase class I/II-fold pyridoxal phosphate-dependent enzyme [Alphaproteobacteria bacterium]NNF72115.1 aminotransferase class I/II-fold pyridoxal phosphate-dependent enzyme [Paracoccaceae bacterium]NNK66005.1 aminotransferase class I/II-fold pyridoxal phosphate-dependent enzyme [Paracoccaceae bacterium]